MEALNVQRCEPDNGANGDCRRQNPRLLHMAAIAPFRHLIVYPALMRDIGQEWQAGAR